MKSLLKALVAVLFVHCTTFSALAEKQTPGPKGGKLLENEPPRAEFFVEKDHSVSITFYDQDLKPVPVAAQVVTATVETNEGKTKLEFEKKGDILVSKSPLPHGDGYNIVVQVRMDPISKPQNFRVKYDSHVCGGCQRQEYACTCDE